VQGERDGNMILLAHQDVIGGYTIVICRGSAIKMTPVDAQS
jgi:hypothetical protein